MRNCLVGAEPATESGRAVGNQEGKKKDLAPLPEPSAIMISPDCGHCLRPTFTARITKSLFSNRRAINLIGAPGQGRTRLLNDLVEIDPDTTLWLRADLKEYRYSYSDMLKALWKQSGLSGHLPRSLGNLLEKLAACDRRVCLLLHNFDAILNNPDLDAGFDVKFLNSLNALKDNASLLCVTERTYKEYVMLEKSGERRVSTLVLEQEVLRPLLLSEIKTEINRLTLDLIENERIKLAHAVLEHALPLPFLTFVCGRIKDKDASTRPFSERLTEWRRHFKLNQPALSPARAITVRHKIATWHRVVGLHRIKLPFRGLVKQLERWIEGKAKKD